MAITYDLTVTSGTVATISAVRFELGDTTDGRGVKPDGSNFTDTEITYLYNQAGSTLGGAAHAAEVLARSWAIKADETAGPLSKKYSQISAAWAKQAETLRAQSGGGAAGFIAYAGRQDGYAYRAGTVDANL